MNFFLHLFATTMHTPTSRHKDLDISLRCDYVSEILRMTAQQCDSEFVKHKLRPGFFFFKKNYYVFALTSRAIDLLCTLTRRIYRYRPHLRDEKAKG